MARALIIQTNAFSEAKATQMALVLLAVMSLSDSLAFVFTHYIGTNLSVAAIAGIGGLLSLIFVVLRALAAGQPELLKTRYPVLQPVRALTRIAGTWLGVYGLLNMPITTFIVIGFFTPLLVVLLSTWLLKERLHRYTLASAGLGLAGVFTIYNVEPTTMMPMMAALAATVIGAANAVFTRKMPNEHPFTFIFYTNLFLAVFFLPFTYRELLDISGFVMMVMIARELLGFLGSYLYFAANQMASPQRIAPITYTKLIWGALLGWLIWGHAPQPVFWVGATLVLAGSALLLYRTDEA